MLTAIRNWSELWALLIPLAVLISHKEVRRNERPVSVYVLIAFFLNLAATTIFVFNKSMPVGFRNNNIFYNLHSITRVFLFGWYFFRLPILSLRWLSKIYFIGYAVFVVVNFLFIQKSLLRFSNLLLTVESILLLTLCVFFLFQAMRDENQNDWIKHPAFLVCAAIGLFEAVSFFIFLAFYDLVAQDKKFGKLTMTIHNMSFVVFCILLSIALYQSRVRIAVREKTEK